MLSPAGQPSALPGQRSEIRQERARHRVNALHRRVQLADETLTLIVVCHALAQPREHDVAEQAHAHPCDRARSGTDVIPLSAEDKSALDLSEVGCADREESERARVGRADATSITRVMTSSRSTSSAPWSSAARWNAAQSPPSYF